MRQTALLGLLAAAVGVPYAASQVYEDGALASRSEAVRPDWPTRANSQSLLETLSNQLDSRKDAPSPSDEPIGIEQKKDSLGPSEVTIQADLAESLWFGMTPNDVLARWPRVASRMSSLDLQGYRVPFVSGTRPDDVAGAMTYYFDSRQRLRRITLRGQTADTSKLVSVLQSLHGFHFQPTTEPLLQLYQNLQPGKPRGQLWIRPAEVVRDRKFPQSFDVLLIMENG